jgi:hypothetical protein
MEFIYQDDPEFAHYFRQQQQHPNLQHVHSGPGKRKNFVQTAQRTRHARRIYIGCIPATLSGEEELRDFLNSVIAKGLGEENDNSYVLSIYLNQKNCFAFVELSSIELTCACLDLDGIVFKNVTLKVTRANEYKPELIPTSLQNKTFSLNLSSFLFGATSNLPQHPSNGVAVDLSLTLETSIHNSAAVDYSAVPAYEPLIETCGLHQIERDSVVLLGFPFDDMEFQPDSRFVYGMKRRTDPKANIPHCLRTLLHKYRPLLSVNPEYEVDLCTLRIFDVGDVLPGGSLAETKLNLMATIAEILRAHAIPLVFGGSTDKLRFLSAGAVETWGDCIGVLNVHPVLDPVICTGAECLLRPTDRLHASAAGGGGRYVQFGAQVIRKSRCCCVALRLLVL